MGRTSSCCTPARFEHKEQARETVTVALDPGERFRAAGYFIQ